MAGPAAKLDFLALLEQEVEAMTSALGAADPDATVASCPGWTVRDLASHVIAVHSWVKGTLGNPGPGDYAEQPQPGDAAEIAGRYHEAGSALIARMRELPSDTPTWSFDPANQTAGYWRRRQLHEISVHRFDVAPYEIPEDVAQDGIDEAVELFVPRMVKAGRATLPEGSLRLVSPARTWTLGAGAPEAVAEGSAADLLLSLWGRGDLIPGPWRDAKLMP